MLQSQVSGSVAQLVEQRTENPCVTGSIPVRATTFKRRQCKWLRWRRFVLQTPKGFCLGHFWATFQLLELAGQTHRGPLWTVPAVRWCARPIPARPRRRVRGWPSRRSKPREMRQGVVDENLPVRVDAEDLTAQKLARTFP